MKFGFKAKALFAVATLAIGGAAHANTSLNETTTGSLFLTVYDSVTSSTYAFDTGLNQSSFDQNGFYQYNIAGDANYQAFQAAVGSNTVQWNIMSGDNGNPIASANALTTVRNGTFSGNGFNTNLNSALVNMNTYATGLNNWASASTTSAFVNDSTNVASAGTALTAWNNGTKTQSLGFIGETLSFYSIGFTGTNKAAPSSAVTRTLLSGVGLGWTLSALGVLTYGTQSAPVPLPAPFALLMGGLALMGAISRRKSEGGAALAA